MLVQVPYMCVIEFKTRYYTERNLTLLTSVCTCDLFLPFCQQHTLHCACTGRPLGDAGIFSKAGFSVRRDVGELEGSGVVGVGDIICPPDLTSSC